jgi:hypothetical protein
VKWYRPCGFGEKDIALWISLENVLWYSESTQEGISARGRIDPRLYILDQEPYGPLSRCIARVRRGGNRSRSLPFRSKGGGRRSPVRIFTRVFITTAIQETDRSGRSRSHKREDPSGEVQIRLDDYLCFDRNDPSWMICNVDPARGKETSSTWVSRFWF